MSNASRRARAKGDHAFSLCSDPIEPDKQTSGSIVWIAGVSAAVLGAYRRGEDRGDW